VYAGRTGAVSVHLRGPAQEWVYPLEVERTVTVSGPLGNTVAAIRGGTVQVLSSPCQEKLCIRAGQIERAGQWLACLPNRVFIEVRGGPREEVDAVSF
jgi:hypothetical protein